MSELTLSNRQTLERIKEKAEADGMEVTLIKKGGKELDCGMDCFVHPPDVSVNEVKLNRDKYFKAWFMEL